MSNTMPYIHRPYAGNEDYPAMRELMVQMYAVNGPPVYCTVGDLDWWRWGPSVVANPMSDVDLWWDEQGALAGILWPEIRGSAVDLALLVHPAHRSLEAAMLDWAEDYYRKTPGTPLSSVTTWAYQGDTSRRALLQQRGYSPSDKAFAFLGRELNSEPPAAPLPPGYAIRHVQSEADFPQRVEVHRDAFAPSRLSVDVYRKLAAEAPTYRPALDLVVTAPDGSFAAYCLVWFDEANKIGVFEPVGCHSAHRQKGLTKAVMVEGLRRLQALGATRAFVNTVRGEPAANALYRSVGFEQIDCNESWKKAL